MSFCNHWLEPTCFFGFKRGDPKTPKLGVKLKNWNKLNKLKNSWNIFPSLLIVFNTKRVSVARLHSLIIYFLFIGGLRISSLWIFETYLMTNGNIVDKLFIRLFCFFLHFLTFIDLLILFLDTMITIASLSHTLGLDLRCVQRYII